MMILRKLLILLVFMQPVLAIAQRTPLDSLPYILEHKEHDTSKCNTLIWWGEQVYVRDPDSAIVLWQNAYDIATRNLDELDLVDSITVDGNSDRIFLQYMASALNNIGYISGERGKVQTQIDYYKRSIKIRYDIDDKRGLGESFNNIGSVELRMGNTEVGLEYFHQSLKLQEEIGDRMGQAYSLANLGSVYYHQGDTATGLEYMYKSLALKREVGDQRGVAQEINNIADIYKDQNDFKRALEMFNEALTIRKEIGDDRGVGISLVHLGSAYCRMGSLDTGLVVMKRGLNILTVIKDLQWMGYACDLISGYHSMNNELDAAERYGALSMKWAQQLGFPVSLERAARSLAILYKKQGNWKGALEMYELQIENRDILRNENTQKASIRQQTKYEFEKDQLLKDQVKKEEARLSAERTSRRDNLQYSVIFIAILVLFGAVLFMGFINVSERMAEGIIFFSFLILFEFLLVLADPYIDRWSGGAPGIKLLFNAGIAAFIFPAHAFFEDKLKSRLLKA